MFKHRDLQMFSLKLYKYEYFSTITSQQIYTSWSEIIGLNFYDQNVRFLRSNILLFFLKSDLS